MNTPEKSGADLLAAYRNEGVEASFSELVRRYSNLVYSTAKRRLGNGALAEDVTQTVFTRLARAVPNLSNDAELSGWLHRTTLHVAVDVWRSETRRRLREHHACAMQSDSPMNSLWDDLAPELDEALNRLNTKEQQAILLRFFEGRTMREIGQVLGVSEDAAKMRVSRGLERLRGLLARQGITCSSVALGALLSERAIEAAPLSLTIRLQSIELPGAGGLAASGGLLSTVLQVPKFYLIGGLTLLLLSGVAFLHMVRSSSGTAEALAGRADGTSPSSKAQWRALLPSTALLQPPRPIAMRFRVVDAETGDGLASARIRAAFFGVGGSGERLEVFTGEDGWAAIPEPLDPEKNRGPNIFVIAEGYVPKVIGLQRDLLEDYIMRLDRALSPGGLIVNEAGDPVSGVGIRIQRLEDHKSGQENITFQLATAASDPHGRWVYPYVPKHYEEIRFILTHDDYAVTLPVVDVREVDLQNLVLVLDRGFTITGRILDEQGHPILGALVREVNNTGYRRLSTYTDYTGSFILAGVWEQNDSRITRPPEMGPDGLWRFRGIRGISQPHAVIAIQADGFAAQTRAINLAEPVIRADFHLSPGHLFHGRVLSESGEPIPGAVVRTDTDDQGARKFVWRTVTDNDGRFEWNSAPAEPVLFWFEAKGYNPLRDTLLVADGTSYEIRLKRGAKE
jgi:RNA polymerase sigma factor (sigma-70 family)